MLSMRVPYRNCPRFTTKCADDGMGGMAVCPSLHLVATSDVRRNTVTFWDMRHLRCPPLKMTSRDGEVFVDAEAAFFKVGVDPKNGSGMRPVCRFGHGLPEPAMNFEFSHAHETWSSNSGFLSFTPCLRSAPRVFLLVTAAAQDTVHVIDVVGQRHAGYLFCLGAIPSPRGVAVNAASDMVAVSAWKLSDDSRVILYRVRFSVTGVEAAKVVRVIGQLPFEPPMWTLRSNGLLFFPQGLRFTKDGTAICVADGVRDRASVFSVHDGRLMKHLVPAIRYINGDVEEVEGGWLMSSGHSANGVEFVSGDEGDAGAFDAECKAMVRGWFGNCCFWKPCALGTMPDLGVVIRMWNQIEVFSTPAMVARWHMWHTMSAIRVAWMTTVVRARHTVATQLYVCG